MRFIVDENTGPIVAAWLKSIGHEVYSVFDESRGLDDDSIIQKANNENYILLTNDKDFGEKVFRENKEHKGIVLLRLNDERPANKIEVLKQLLETYSEKLSDNFVVVTETALRFAKR